MERHPTKSPLRLFRPAAVAWALVLIAASAGGLGAQQPRSLPPAFKDLAAVGIPINVPQQAANPGLSQPTGPAPQLGSAQQTGLGRNTDDPNHIFGTRRTRASADAEAATIVVLKNGRVIHGTVRADARGYFVESPRSSVYFPFEQVKFVAADLQTAYAKLCQSMTDRSIRRDLMLGRWCVENDLRPEAAAHFRDVLKVDATNHEALQSLARLEQTQTGAATPEPTNRTRRANADAQIPESLSRLSGSTVREFVLGIQPMLLSRCGTVKCHGGTDAAEGSSFRLEHVRFSQGSNRAATGRNLDAVLKLIDGQFASQSQLFSRGLVPHGGGSLRPPLDGPAGRTQEARLRRWVESVASQQNRLRREDSSRRFVNRFTRSPKTTAMRDSSVIHDPNVVPASAAENSPQNENGRESGDRPATAGSQNQPESARRLGPLSDPFDPAQFNGAQPKLNQLNSP